MLITQEHQTWGNLRRIPPHLRAIDLGQLAEGVNPKLDAQ
jgi:hypothetical protein